MCGNSTVAVWSNMKVMGIIHSGGGNAAAFVEETRRKVRAAGQAISPQP